MSDRENVPWLSGVAALREAGEVFPGILHASDKYMSAASEVFGPETEITPWAPIDPDTSRPWMLFILVNEPVDSEEAWNRLARVEEVVGDVTNIENAESAAERVAVTLSGPPDDWRAFRSRIRNWR
jgi:hypothetical protein